MTSRTETGLVALVAALAAAATTDPDMLPQPLRNEALPARLLDPGDGIARHLNVWDGDTEIEQQMLGADVLADGFELAHDAAIEIVVAGGTASAREAAFDAAVNAIAAAVAADRTLGGAVDDCRVTAIASKQRELVADGLPNAKGAELTVRLSFVASDIR